MFSLVSKENSLFNTFIRETIVTGVGGNVKYGTMLRDLVTNSCIKTLFFLYPIGQQFTIFYGVRANIDLLVHNGFVFESNKDDCLTLKLGISKNDALANDKVKILEALSIPRTGLFFISCDLEEKSLDPALLGFLRVLCLTKKEIEEFQGNHDQIKSLLEPEIDGELFHKFVAFFVFVKKLRQQVGCNEKGL